MAAAEFDNDTTVKPLSLDAVDALAVSLNKIDVDDSEHIDPAPRPFFSYSRRQIIWLHKSPLVHLPERMPELKEWFGDWNEQFTPKKDVDPSTTSSTNRDRRFRRDPEDSESNTVRPSFRTSLTQPSQMGNFRHQSTRTSDRDRDKDTEKEKDRDRDAKDGQDRLRSLSDKYDRDRLGLASGSSTARSRDRDSASHLAGTTSNRASSHASLPAASRRAEVGGQTKRRNGENSDDWRRGAEPPRLSREDKSDGYRRDREARERGADSSRPRRDSSTSRRDRDRDDKDRERDRPVRGMDHYSPPRDKDDDSRKWRDDGRREERLAARREKDRDTRERDRAYDNEKEDKARDRERDRWHTAEERDGRVKRPAKERKYVEDGKEKEDHRDKEREKEPAWMETYVPSDSHAGILGGQSAVGEMDSIQAWKKGMKEKEEKEKQTVGPETKQTVDSGHLDQQESQMDEIQLFKMLIKREADKTDVEQQPSSASTPLPSSGSIINDTKSSSNVSHEQPSVPTSTDSISGPRVSVQNPTAPVSAASTQATLDAPRSLLSLITSPSNESSNSLNSSKPSASPLDPQRSSGSRFFPKPLNADVTAAQKSEKAPGERLSPSPASEYHPSQSSRLLALGSQSSLGPMVHSSKSHSSAIPINVSPAGSQPSLQQLHTLQQAQLDLTSHSSGTQFLHRTASPFGSGQRPSPTQHQDQFSPFDHGMTYGEKDQYAQQYDAYRRTSGMSTVSSESGTYGDVNNGTIGITGNGNHATSFDLPTSGNVSGGFSSGKGSRFAKFFDNKAKEPQTGAMAKSTGLLSPSPLRDHRQDVNRVLMENHGDNRTMEDIFAMLQSSAQGQRINHPAQLGQMSMIGSSSLGQSMSMQHQQSRQQQHLQHNGRPDALYDSRFEDKSFMPDGMVPGLRTTLPSRRDMGGYVPEHLEEQLSFGLNRPPPQPRNGDIFGNGAAQIYPHQQGFIRNVPPQQPSYRGNPSPIASQNPHQPIPQQRLPPGLANLGGRPPHDSGQYFGNTIAMQNASQMNLQHNGTSQQSFPNYQATAGVGFVGAPQMRLPTANQAHMQGVIGHSHVGHLNAMEVRGGGQGQLLGQRGGYTSQQLAQIQAQQLGLRSQQHLAQNLVQQLPHHLQQPSGVPGSHNQPAQDLMALLMGNNGPHQE